MKNSGNRVKTSKGRLSCSENASEVQMWRAETNASANSSNLHLQNLYSIEKIIGAFWNSLIVPKMKKVRPFLHFLTSILMQNMKTMKWGPLETFKNIRVSVPKKIEMGPFSLVRFCNTSNSESRARQQILRVAAHFCFKFNLQY